MVGGVELPVKIVAPGNVVADVVGIELLVGGFVGSVIKTKELRASIEDSVVKGADVDEFAQEVVGDVKLDAEVIDSETFVVEVAGIELGVEKFVGSVIKNEELKAPIEDSVCVDMGVEVDEFS